MFGFVRYFISMLCIGAALFVNFGANAQCHESLVERLIEKSGTEALFMRDFGLMSEIKAKKKKDRLLLPTKKYDVRLNKGVVYRFMVADDDSLKSPAILQLIRSNVLLGSTYETGGRRNMHIFDYFCHESGPYTVVMSYAGENGGCAAGAMFALVQDTSTLATIIDSMEIQNILYSGTDNFVDIAASDIPGGSLEVGVSRGTIVKEGGLYKINVDGPGKLLVHVTARDKNGVVTETFNTEFIVMAPMLPTVSLMRSSGGIIKKSELLAANPSIEIHNYRHDIQFKIKKFELTQKLSFSGITVYNDKNLSLRQINLIREMKPGETFYITNIEVEDTKGNVIKLEPLGFIIGE
jgi:hypothetical protein